MSNEKILTNAEVAKELGISVTQVNIIKKRGNITHWTESAVQSVKDTQVAMNQRSEKVAPKLNALPASHNNQNVPEPIQGDVGEPGELQNIDESALNTIENGTSELSLGVQMNNQAEEIRLENQQLDEALIEVAIAESYLQGKTTQISKEMAYEEGIYDVKRQKAAERLQRAQADMERMASTDLGGYISQVLGKRREFSTEKIQSRTQEVRRNYKNLIDSIGI